MRCERCHKNEAKIGVSINQNNQQRELFLCEECAQELFQQDTEEENYVLNNDFFMTDSSVKTCQTCGTTLKEILENGLFGCEDCYNTFPEDTEQIIRRVQHLKDTHTGKVPASFEARLQHEEKIARLEEKLGQLIETQDFEEAAVVRDEINALKEDDNGEDESMAE